MKRAADCVRCEVHYQWAANVPTPNVCQRCGERLSPAKAGRGWDIFVTLDAKNPAAVALGRLGGAKGGHARAAKLSPERRREIAQRAARARWGIVDIPGYGSIIRNGDHVVHDACGCDRCIDRLLGGHSTASGPQGPT